MSKMEILQELPNLSTEDRQEIRFRLAELDNDDWLDDDELTPEDKHRIEQRVAEFERNPQTSIPWAVAEAHLTSRFGQ